MGKVHGRLLCQKGFKNDFQIPLDIRPGQTLRKLLCRKGPGGLLWNYTRVSMVRCLALAFKGLNTVHCIILRYFDYPI